MNLTEEARRLLTCDELRGRVPQEVQEFLRKVAGLEPLAYDILSDGCHQRFVTPSVKDNWLAAFKRPAAVPLYTLDCVAATGCKVTTEKMEPRHDQP